MAIDTADKRLSAVAARRLPWMRRFQPLPDSTMDSADHQQLALVYNGIAAQDRNAPVVEVTLTIMR